MEYVTGSVPLGQLPPPKKNAVRVFLCSAGQDTREERDYLLENAYHKLSSYCRYKYGIEFMMVDLKWGVPESILERFYSEEFARAEITRCREQSLGPDLVIILGQKYGQPSPPTSILANRYEMFLSLLAETESKFAAVLEYCYYKDENAVPPMYTQKSMDSIKKGLGEAAQSLPDAIKEAAKLAHKKGLINEEESEAYVLSDIGVQVQCGLANRSVVDTKDRCLYVKRSIPDVTDHLLVLRAERFVDLRKGIKKINRQMLDRLEKLENDTITESIGPENTMKLDIEWQISGGNVNTDNSNKIRKISKAVQKWSKGTLNLYRHENYLDDMCKEFIRQMKSLINRSMAKVRAQDSTVVSSALTQLQVVNAHLHKFIDVPEVSDALAKFHQYLNGVQNKPLLIRGKSGSGKTCLVANMISTLQHKYCVLVRILESLPHRTLEEVLDSINQQLSYAFGKKQVATFGYNDTVQQFRSLIKLSSTEKPLCVVIDGLNLLYDGDVELDWLPQNLPPDTRVIIAMTTKPTDVIVDDHMYCSIDVTGFGKETAIEVLKKRLGEKTRVLSEEQMRKVSGALGRNSSPIFVDVLFTMVMSCNSFDSLQGLNWCTVEETMSLVFQKLEVRYGETLVRHIVSYITAARHGITEQELDSILSIDDRLLTSLFDDWMPPVRRMPSLLWLRVLHELRPFLAEIQLDETVLLTWHHREIKEACKAYCFSEASHKQYISSTMADFFMGLWGGGRRKQFNYSDEQVKRFDPSHSRNRSSADRIVPESPYKYAASMNPQGHTHRCNFRKLSELPYHLMNSDNVDFLLDYILFDYRYLHTKIKACGVMSTMKEYLYFQSQPQLQGIMDLIALVATLRKIMQTIHKYPNTLNVELTGRLSHMITISPYMKSLIKQCDQKASTACPLVPTFTCYDTLQAGTVGTIQYTRNGTTARERGLTTSSASMSIIVSKDDAGKEFTIWDSSNCERKDAIQIKQTPKEKIYKQTAVTPDGRHLLCICQTPFFCFEVYCIETGDCVASRLEADTDEMHKLCCLTNSYMVVETESCLLKVYNIFLPKEIEEYRGFEAPMCITPNERYFIGLKEGQLHICSLEKGNVLTQFSGGDEAVRLAVHHNSRRLLVGLATGIIRVYNLSTVHRNLPLHSMAEYPPNDLKEEHSYIAHDIEKRQMKVTGLVYFQDGSKFLADYDSRYGKISILWDYADVSIVCLLQGNILGETALFNNDGSLIIRYTQENASKTVINIYRTDDGGLTLTCDMKDIIHNVHISNRNSLAAITISDTILVINVLQILAANKFRKTMTLNPYQSVSNSFRFPKFLADGNFVYSDDIIIPPFHYFDIQANEMKSVDLVGFHTEYLNEFPQERMLSPDGRRILYTFYSKSGPVPVQHDLGIDYPEKTFMTTMTRTGQGQRRATILERKDTQARLSNMQSPSAGGRHCILRAFDVTSGDLEYQINLESERCLHVTSSSLVTKKTIQPYRKQGKPTYMINIYNLITGAYELSITEDTNVVELMDDNTKLVTLRGLDLTLLTVYCLRESPKQILRYKLQQALGPISIKKMTTFPFRPSHILFTYTSPFVQTEHRSYCLFDTQMVSAYQPIIGVDGGFKDVSQDGKIAIDKTLKLYDLETGTILKQIVPHIGRKELNMEAKLTYDSRYIIWYDARDQTLCVAKNSAKTDMIAKCVVHKTSKQRHKNGRTTIHLSNCGRTIVVTDNEEFKVYSLRADDDPLQKNISRPTTGFYRNSQVRAGYLLNRIMSVPLEKTVYPLRAQRESAISPLYA